jgi:hypothetical protein
MNDDEEYLEHMRLLERDIKSRIAEANTFERDSKQRSSRIGTAYAVLQGTLRMRNVHPQDEDHLRAILEREGVPPPRGCERKRPKADEA